MKRIDPKCNTCGNTLTNNNWNPSHKKQRDYRCKHCYNQKSLKYRQKNPDAEFKARLKKKYGITFEEYLQIFTNQEGKCAICNEKEIAKKKNGDSRWLAVDHCHKTGKVRKLLCTKCNNGLGNFNDDLVLLQRAYEYIQNQ